MPLKKENMGFDKEEWLVVGQVFCILFVVIGIIFLIVRWIVPSIITLGVSSILYITFHLMLKKLKNK